jgi:hypothetical protein
LSLADMSTTFASSLSSSDESASCMNAFARTCQALAPEHHVLAQRTCLAACESSDMASSSELSLSELSLSLSLSLSSLPPARNLDTGGRCCLVG